MPNLRVSTFAKRSRVLISISRRMFIKAVVFTRPTPARQDAPFHKQGRSERRGEAYFFRTVSL